MIQDKEYVEKRESRFYPPPESSAPWSNELLVKAFPNVVDVGFTAAMEEQLDEIAEGTEDWVHVLDVFYDPYKKELAQAEEHMRDVKREETPTDLKCEKCGSPMVIKWGKMGRFLACSGYPECKTTVDFETKPDGFLVPVKEQVTEQDHRESAASPWRSSSGAALVDSSPARVIRNASRVSHSRSALPARGRAAPAS